MQNGKHLCCWNLMKSFLSLIFFKSNRLLRKHFLKNGALANISPYFLGVFFSPLLNQDEISSAEVSEYLLRDFFFSHTLLLCTDCDYKYQKISSELYSHWWAFSTQYGFLALYVINRSVLSSQSTISVPHNPALL